MSLDASHFCQACSLYVLALPVSTLERCNQSNSAGQAYKMPLSAGHSQWLCSAACGDAICFTLIVESCAWMLFFNLPSLQIPEWDASHQSVSDLYSVSCAIQMASSFLCAHDL